MLAALSSSVNVTVADAGEPASTDAGSAPKVMTSVSSSALLSSCMAIKVKDEEESPRTNSRVDGMFSTLAVSVLTMGISTIRSAAGDSVTVIGSCTTFVHSVIMRVETRLKHGDVSRTEASWETRDRSPRRSLHAPASRRFD